jgi:hypothetical protein
MAPSVKVGNWLQDPAKNGNGASNEAYESGSGSESESEASTSAVTRGVGRAGAAVEVGGAEEAEENAKEVKVQEEIDWNDVLGRLKRAVGDPSQKRRQSFIGKYLSVNSDCESFLGTEG